MRREGYAWGRRGAEGGVQQGACSREWEAREGLSCKSTGVGT